MVTPIFLLALAWLDALHSYVPPSRVDTLEITNTSPVCSSSARDYTSIWRYFKHIFVLDNHTQVDIYAKEEVYLLNIFSGSFYLALLGDDAESYRLESQSGRTYSILTTMLFVQLGGCKKSTKILNCNFDRFKCE